MKLYLTNLDASNTKVGLQTSLLSHPMLVYKNQQSGNLLYQV